MSNSKERGHQSPYAVASVFSNHSVVNMWALSKDPQKELDELLEQAEEQNRKSEDLLKKVAECEKQVKELAEDSNKRLAKAKALDCATRRVQTKCALQLAHLVTFDVDQSTASNNSSPGATRASRNSRSRRSQHGHGLSSSGDRRSDNNLQ